MERMKMKNTLWLCHICVVYKFLSVNDIHRNDIQGKHKEGFGYPMSDPSPYMIGWKQE